MPKESSQQSEQSEIVILFGQTFTDDTKPLAWAEDDEEIEEIKDVLEEKAEGHLFIEEFKIGDLPHVTDWVVDDE